MDWIIVGSIIFCGWSMLNVLSSERQQKLQELTRAVEELEKKPS